jgi:hypothetical protein
VRGGLGYSVIIVGFILGAITGTVAGQVIAMALISLPVMIRYGYNMRYATGVLAASGTITQLVPPSLVLIVLADQWAAGGRHVPRAWGLHPAGTDLRTYTFARIKPTMPGANERARTAGWALWPNACAASSLRRADLPCWHGRPARPEPVRHADGSRRHGRVRAVLRRC